MKEEFRISLNVRDPSPCLGCTERFTACSGKCPKDERGEYGYNAWKAYIAQVKREKRNYLKNREFDLKRRELWSTRK